MDRRFWFKPKRYGYGATPVTWEGWALVAAFIAIAVAIASLPQLRESALGWIGLIAATLVLIGVSYVKTDGQWHWSWGSNEFSGKNK